MTVDSAYKILVYERDDEVTYRFPTESIGSEAIYVLAITVEPYSSTLLQEGVDYTLAFDESQTPTFIGGTITLTEPLAPGLSLQVRRLTPIINDLVVQSLEPFPSEEFEYMMDKICFIQQEIEGTFCDCRAICTPVYITEQPVDQPGSIPAYVCDSFLTQVQALNPYLYYQGYRNDGGASPVDQSGNGRTGNFGLSNWSDPNTNPTAAVGWIDPCVDSDVVRFTGGSGTTNNITWNTTDREMQPVVGDLTYVFAAIPAIPQGTAIDGYLVGLDTDILNSGSAPYDYGYDIRWQPDTGRFTLGVLSDNNPDLYVRNNAGTNAGALGYESGTNNPMWRLFVVRVRRTTSVLQWTVHCDGILQFDITTTETGNSNGTDLANSPYWNPGATTHYFTPKWGSNGATGWSALACQVTHMSVHDSPLTQQQIDDLQAAWELNKDA